MHSFWFALQRNGFILNPPNFDAFFSSLLIKIPYSGFPKPHFFAFRTGFNSPFTQMQTFSASNICLLKSTSSRSIDYSPLSTSTLHAIWPHNHQPQYNERKETRKEWGQKKDLANCFARSFVTPTGFKPVTFWSVVRCSIQLSYGAIFLKTAHQFQ